MAKKIIIIAGPNGAGKTTFARAFLPAEAQCLSFINADLIAVGLSPFAPDAAAIRAGRLMLLEISKLAKRGESFAFETTLSGLGYLRHIREWQALGFHVTIYFLTIPTADIAIKRVAERVKHGGHNVPENVIRRRYEAGCRNFEAHYRQAADSWIVYDNAAKVPRVTQWGERK